MDWGFLLLIISLAYLGAESSSLRSKIRDRLNEKVDNYLNIPSDEGGDEQNTVNGFEEWSNGKQVQKEQNRGRKHGRAKERSKGKQEDTEQQDESIMSGVFQGPFARRLNQALGDHSSSEEMEVAEWKLEFADADDNHTEYTEEESEDEYEMKTEIEVNAEDGNDDSHENADDAVPEIPKISTSNNLMTFEKLAQKQSLASLENLKELLDVLQMAGSILGEESDAHDWVCETLKDLEAPKLLRGIMGKNLDELKDIKEKVQRFKGNDWGMGLGWDYDADHEDQADSDYQTSASKDYDGKEETGAGKLGQHGDENDENFNEDYFKSGNLYHTTSYVS